MKTEELLVLRFKVEGGDFARAGDVSCRIKNLLKEIGLSPSVIRRAAIAAYEAEMNLIMYARRGQFEVTIGPESIRIVVADEGPGIENLELAMREGWSTATAEMRELGFGAGMGLPNIERNSDRFFITSTVGRGTELDITIRNNGTPS